MKVKELIVRALKPEQANDKDIDVAIEEWMWRGFYLISRFDTNIFNTDISKPNGHVNYKNYLISKLDTDVNIKHVDIMYDFMHKYNLMFDDGVSFDIVTVGEIKLK